MFLEIKNIKKHFGEGESVLLGPSGSGKSTLLNIIGGIDAADEGYISINGEKTADMNEKALTLYRRKHLGYIFQMYNLIPNLNIKENIEVGAYLSELLLAEPSSRILISCSATSLQVRLTTIPPRRYCSL